MTRLGIRLSPSAQQPVDLPGARPAMQRRHQSRSVLVPPVWRSPRFMSAVVDDFVTASFSFRRMLLRFWVFRLTYSVIYCDLLLRRTPTCIDIVRLGRVPVPFQFPALLPIYLSEYVAALVASFSCRAPNRCLYTYYMGVRVNLHKGCCALHGCRYCLQFFISGAFLV